MLSDGQDQIHCGGHFSHLGTDQAAGVGIKPTTDVSMNTVAFLSIQLCYEKSLINRDLNKIDTYFSRI